MNLTDSDDDLYKQLVDTEYAMHPRERQTAYWVMNKDWRDRLKAMRHGASGPLQVLLGKRVKITEDGGEPHLVAEPQRRDPQRFEDLARYNAERGRGIMHTREWRDKMAGIQADFDQCQRDGTLPLPDWEYDFLMERGQ